MARGEAGVGGEVFGASGAWHEGGRVEVAVTMQRMITMCAISKL